MVYDAFCLVVYALSLSPCSSSVLSAINTVIRRPFLIESATVGILKGNGEGREGRQSQALLQFVLGNRYKFCFP